MTRQLTSTTIIVRTAVLFLTTFLLESCQRDYSQFYKDFSEFNEATPRQKSWFPNLISENCHDIQGLHYLKQKDTTNYFFGVFSYYDSQKMTSELADSTYEKIGATALQDRLDKIPQSEIPSWFIDETGIINSAIYQNKKYFIIDNRTDKCIYFIYDGS